LSPYVMGSPAIGYRFFGRQALLKRISARANTSITLIGTRRIGKTSLLHELKRQFTIRYPEVLVAHLYGSNLDTAHEVLSRIIEDTLHAARVARIQVDKLMEKELGNELRKVIERGRHRVAIFIDEIDHILDWDEKQDFRLLNFFRELSYSEYCTFYFAGYRSTLKAVEDVNNPLYNFTSAERILPFQRHETFEMVEHPLENLGLPVTVAGLADLIHRESGGQPELIQYMCNKVLEIYSGTNEVITPEQLSAQLTIDPKFESTIFRQFAQNIPKRTLLSVLLFLRSRGDSLDTSDFHFTATDLAKAVQEKSVDYGVHTTPEHVRDLAADLELAGVITRTGIRAPITYRFTVPRLGDYYVVMGIENEIKRLVAEEA